MPTRRRSSAGRCLPTRSRDAAVNTRDVSMLVDGLAFGEGPRWHDGKLFLSDMHSHRVLSIDAADGATTVVAEHDSPLSGIGWLPDGRLLVVAMDGAVMRLD